MQTVFRNINSTHLVRNNKMMIKFLILSIPGIVLLDWLFDFGILNIQLGLYVKALSVILFSYYLILRKIKDFAVQNLIIYFLLLNVIYSIFSPDIFNNLYFSVRIAYWVFGTIVIYQLIQFNWLLENHIQNMIKWTALIATIFSIVLMNQVDEHQNASAYLLIWCMPILLTFKQSSFIRIVQLLAIIAIMMTIKRGAMLALMISIFAFIFAMLKNSDRIILKSKIIFSGLVFLGLALAVVFLNWESVSARLEDKGGSGRDIMYTGIFQHYINGDLLAWIFGFGINSVQKFTVILFSAGPDNAGVAAHSDWLQYMHDFGFLGILFMLGLHFKFIQLIKFHKKYKSKFYPMLLMAYSIFFLTTIYSFILNTPNAIFLGIILAIGSAEMNKIKSQNLLV